VQFKDIIGQEDVKRHLIEMYAQNRLSHALLFLGKEGNGGLTLAIAFAQYVNCDLVNGRTKSNENDLFGDASPTTPQQHSVAEDSCGTCLSCQKAAKFIHPDIHFSYPSYTRKANERSIATNFITEWRNFIVEHPYGNNYDWLQFIAAENKQGNISTHECEEIARKLSLKSYESEYKFLIMWMPEFLGKEGNKLLKLIEEPPAKTIFIFVAENEQLIIPTILSRTQLIKIPALSVGNIENALIEQHQLAADKAHQIAIMSEGNFREALQMLETNEDNWEQILRAWLNSILKTGPVAQVKWIEEIAKIGREKQKQFLKFFTHLLEQAVRLEMMGDQANEMDESNELLNAQLDFASRLNRLCDIQQKEAIIHELDTATYHVERNANPKILFHALTIKIYHIISNKSVILVS